jgi:hypothetical protein
LGSIQIFFWGGGVSYVGGSSHIGYFCGAREFFMEGELDFPALFKTKSEIIF